MFEGEMVYKPGSRNLKNIRISAEAVLSLLLLSSAKLPEVIHLPALRVVVPEGARLLGVRYEWDTKCFAFTFEHPDFPEVPEGMFLPSEYVPWETIQTDEYVRWGDGIPPATVVEMKS